MSCPFAIATCIRCAHRFSYAASAYLVLQVAAPALPKGSWGSGVSFAQRLAQKEAASQQGQPLPVAQSATDARSTAQPASKVGVDNASHWLVVCMPTQPV